MNYDSAPVSVRSLEQRLRNLEGTEGLALRRRVAMALVVVDQLSNDLAEFFTEVGLEEPKPVPVMRADHQIAQKLHAVSSPGSERVRDLVDLQLLDKNENLDLAQIAETCRRLFDYRRQQSWPPTIQDGDQWDTLYLEAAEDIDVLPTVEEAIAWTNELIRRITVASRTTDSEGSRSMADRFSGDRLS